MTAAAFRLAAGERHIDRKIPQPDDAERLADEIQPKMQGQEFDERGSFDSVDLDIEIRCGNAQHRVADAAANEPRVTPRCANRRADRIERAASRRILDVELELFGNETRHQLGMIDPVGSSCLLAGDLLASSVISGVRRRASRGTSGPLAHPLQEFLSRASTDIHALGGVQCIVRRHYGSTAGLVSTVRSGR